MIVIVGNGGGGCELQLQLHPQGITLIVIDVEPVQPRLSVKNTVITFGPNTFG